MREGWEYICFESCLNKIPKAKQVKTKEYNSGTKYPIISQEDKLISGYCDDESMLFHIDKPVIIFGDHTRVLKYIDFDFVVGADGVKIISPKENLNAKFLLYFLTWYNIPNLGYSRHYKLLKELDIPVPPLSTQLSIVSELDKINELIRLKKEQLKDYDNLAQSIFYEMFGDPHDNEKRWDEVIVGDVCAPKAQILRASKIFGSTDEIQYIDISSIDNLAHEMTKCTTYTMSDAPSRAQQCVKKGDIIISTVRPNIKNIAIVSKDDENLVASSGFCILRPNNIDRNFLFHYILSEYYTEYLVNLTTGANYPAVRDSDILKSKIYYPPISIQQSFAQRIELIKKQKAEIQSTITDLETLLASRMQYWFD